MALCKFAQEEDGVLIKPTIFIFLSMLTVGGIGIDLMRMERDRTELQYTLDRAVLAAADLDQTQTPAAVVLDYLTKSGLSEYYSTPTSDIGLGYRIVTSTVNTNFDTHFMNLTGVSSIPIYASSTAEESIDGLEISLVLDVSGSMNSNSRLTNLKVAAKDFIDTMVENTTDGKMSISIIPYATQVSAPEELFDQYNVTSEHTYSNCVNFSSSDFNSTAVSTTAELERTMHFSPWYYNDTRGDSDGDRVPRPVCSDRVDREILLFQKNATTLKAFIDDLYAWGNTSIDLGMKWGTALLDPSAQPAITELSTGSGAIIPNDFSARPSEYSDSDTIKVVVLMTDGQNTSQYYVEDDHRRGLSEVWYDAASDRYSIPKNSSTYYWPHNGYSYSYKTGTNPQQLSYADLWAYTSLKHNYYYNYRPWQGSSSAKSEWYYGVYDYYNTSTKNSRTNNICDAAKAAGIIVYTIGFEAPSGGQAVLQDCASSDAHYFDVSGLEITDAFASIATSIRQLRLTQ
ncbi:TadE/TadG family type IV pilus assembly protein [Parasedimentitalea marina]|nr:TadE/TadG family type IV pilus assembly protein [Parasedimentitalea marina]